MTAPLETRAQDLASRLPPLLVAAERIAASLAAGAHGRRRTGPGETFWQFRSQQPGDSLTAIDWRQSARSQRLFVRETEWAAAQTVWIWRDGSASMAWRSHPSVPEKRDRADVLALALAALLLRGGERVALLDGSLPPTTGGGALQRFAHALSTSGQAPLPGPERLAHHAQLVLLSDFLMPAESVTAQLRALGAAGAVGHLVQILDPAEESLPYDGRVRFTGLEGEGDMIVRRAEDVRAGYRERLAAHRDALATAARAFGWSFAIHHTDHPPEAALLALHLRLSGPRAGGLGQ